MKFQSMSLLIRKVSTIFRPPVQVYHGPLFLLVGSVFKTKKEAKKVLKGFKEDYLRSELRKLPDQMRLAIILRFWHLETIESISQYMNIKWSEANKLIEEGVSLLKRGSLSGLFDKKLKQGEVK